MNVAERRTLRLSAQRALNGCICDGVREVWVRKRENRIEIKSIVSLDHHVEAEECLRVAGSEILADYPTMDFEEHFEFTNDKLNSLHSDGYLLVFQRFEPPN